MLSQMQHLSVEADGRYATDDELKFLANYVKSYESRLQAYQKVQACEETIIQQTFDKLRAQDPTLFRHNNNDVTGHCKRDMLFNLRYAMTAMLIDDPDMLRERYLFWCQTIMRAYGLQRKCTLSYSTMQDVIKQNLDAQSASLVNDMLEINRRMLGGV